MMLQSLKFFNSLNMSNLPTELKVLTVNILECRKLAVLSLVSREWYHVSKHLLEKCPFGHINRNSIDPILDNFLFFFNYSQYRIHFRGITLYNLGLFTVSELMMCVDDPKVSIFANHLKKFVSDSIEQYVGDINCNYRPCFGGFSSMAKFIIEQQDLSSYSLDMYNKIYMYRRSNGSKLLEKRKV